MKKICAIGLILTMIQSCTQPAKEQVVQSNSDTVVSRAKAPESYYISHGEQQVADSASTGEMHAEGEAETTRPYFETKLRFPDYMVVFQDFKGYTVNETEDADNHTYYGEFGGGGDTNEAVLNITEIEKVNADGEVGYETEQVLVAKKDTIHLSEELFDERIDNTLIRIIPRDKGDRYQVSFCYLSSLTEIVDHRAYKHQVTDQELETLYKNRFEKPEQTPYYPLKDSARFYFRALPHTPDMVEVTVKDDKVVPVKPRSKEDMESEAIRYKLELFRIKQKYKFRDTLVHFPSEGGCTDGMFVKGEKLFTYGYHSYLFKIERYANGKFRGAKYVVVAIAYGC